MNKQIELLITLQDLINLKKDMENESTVEQFKEMGFELNRLEKIEETIKDISSKLRSDIFQIYKRVASKYERPLVPVRNGVCYGCFVSLATSKASTEDERDSIKVCEHCGRIIYQIT